MKDDLLRDVLRSVSRAFYLSMWILPPACRSPIATGYLLARAADTIADTPHLPPERRLEALRTYARQLESGGPSAELAELAALAGDGDSSEQKLLRRLPDTVALLDLLGPEDRASVRRIVATLISGMEEDLRQFPAGQLSALPDEAALDRHTYMAAGCVGEFWTEILLRHVPQLAGVDRALLLERGVRFGKALQLTNVLRDIPADLKNGRCYLPVPPDQIGEQAGRRAFATALRQAVEHYRAANEYIGALPGPLLRLRLSVLWPALIGLGTLARLAQQGGALRGGGAVPPLGHEVWLHGPRVKVPRSWVYKTLFRSLFVAPWRGATRRWVAGWIAEVEKRC